MMQIKLTLFEQTFYPHVQQLHHFHLFGLWLDHLGQRLLCLVKRVETQIILAEQVVVR